MKQLPITSYANLDRNKEFVSENATRSIFGWLRFEGYAAGERDIWEHEWFDILESDEDEEPDIASPGNWSKSSSLHAWMAQTELAEHKD
jgi:hypothetical protein